MHVDDDVVYWLEARPSEAGRNVVVRRDPGGTVEDVTPPGFNVRSRVHEYGGGAFTVHDGTVFFVNDADQRVWAQPRASTPRPLTPESGARYADLEVDAVYGRIICVREEQTGTACVNAIVSLPLTGGAPEVLVRGADFYASPRLDPTCSRLAYLSWNHPNLPWDGTELWVAGVGGGGQLQSFEKVAGGAEESIFQPSFSPDGVLHFVSDRSGWWNLYRTPAQPLWPVDAECGTPQWVFGLSTYAWVDRSTIACAFQRQGTWRLALIDANGARPIELSSTEIAYVRAGSGRAYFVGSSPSDPAAIWCLSAGGGSTWTPSLVHQPSRPAVDAAYLSRPEPITFATGGGEIAHGLFYAPRNPDFTAPHGERPPLLVLSHGGPTAAASSALNLAIQFWTSRGFGVLDVNYRGSTGYGRSFRQALRGRWGIADVEDCVAGARHVVARGSADGDRLAIRGSSAGGYTTLAALTFTNAFRTGASYYGISDLEALARDTHKFESRYLDHLIGPYPERADVYRARSPIHHVGRLSSPVIFFQGLQDRVVPPDQAERMVAALRRKGVRAEYVTFADEQHGFRSAENAATALEAELAFYLSVFGLAGAAVSTRG